MHASGKGKQASRTYFFLSFPRSILTDWVGSEGERCRCLSTLSKITFRMHATGPGGQACGIFKPFACSLFHFYELDGGGERGAGDSYSRRQRFLHACQPVGK